MQKGQIHLCVLIASSILFVYCASSSAFSALQTPLGYARCNNRIACVEYLLSVGATDAPKGAPTLPAAKSPTLSPTPALTPQQGLMNLDLPLRDPSHELMTDDQVRKLRELIASHPQGIDISTILARFKERFGFVPFYTGAFKQHLLRVLPDAQILPGRSSGNDVVILGKPTETAGVATPQNSKLPSPQIDTPSPLPAATRTPTENLCATSHPSLSSSSR